MICFILSAVFITVGLFLELSAIVGVYRFDTALTRMHAAALGDTMGLFFIMLGLAFIRGFSFDSLKLLLIVFLLWNTSPISTHLIGKLEYETNDRYRENSDGDT